MALSAIAILQSANKTNTEETHRLDDQFGKLRDRVCWLETHAGKDSCEGAR